MSDGARAGSLVARLVLLFMLGSAIIMASAGYSLYHALRMRLEANDDAEVSGKTQVIEHLLRGVDSAQALRARLTRIHDVTVGHPRLTIGVWSEGTWLLALPDQALATAGALVHGHGMHHEYIRSGERSWLVHRLVHKWRGPPAGEATVVLAVETTETSKLLAEHAILAALVALLGTAASALLAWFVARRGLAPLAHVAARAEEVTARRLGDRLDLKDAPREVHGLADSINRMLERLEESFRALEQFSADIAHELRTPLNNLLLQTQVTLGRPRTAEEYQDTLQVNLEELERLQRMVVDMLFLARADRGMIELNVEDIALRPEIASVVEYFEPAAAERSQRIVVRGEGGLRADRLLLRRALNNLLSNAVRYSPSNSTIEVAIEADAQGESITVSNPGDPIPQAELRRLFARFARRDDSRGRDVEGAGLGLAIVDSIMKLQGGAVDASSEDGTVRFRLRFSRANLTNL